MENIGYLFTVFNLIIFYNLGLAKKIGESCNQLLGEIMDKYKGNLTDYSNIIISEGIDQNYLDNIIDSSWTYYSASIENMIKVIRYKYETNQSRIIGIICLVLAVASSSLGGLYENSPISLKWVIVICP